MAGKAMASRAGSSTGDGWQRGAASLRRQCAERARELLADAPQLAPARDLALAAQIPGHAAGAQIEDRHLEIDAFEHRVHRRTDVEARPAARKVITDRREAL